MESQVWAEDLLVNFVKQILNFYTIASELGWGVVDCDKLGHIAYSPGKAFSTFLI